MLRRYTCRNSGRARPRQAAPGDDQPADIDKRAICALGTMVGELQALMDAIEQRVSLDAWQKQRRELRKAYRDSNKNHVFPKKSESTVQSLSVVRSGKSGSLA